MRVLPDRSNARVMFDGVALSLHSENGATLYSSLILIVSHSAFDCTGQFQIRAVHNFPRACRRRESGLPLPSSSQPFPTLTSHIRRHRDHKKHYACAILDIEEANQATRCGSTIKSKPSRSGSPYNPSMPSGECWSWEGFTLPCVSVRRLKHGTSGQRHVKCRTKCTTCLTPQQSSTLSLNFPSYGTDIRSLLTDKFPARVPAARPQSLASRAVPA